MLFSYLVTIIMLKTYMLFSKIKDKYLYFCIKIKITVKIVKSFPAPYDENKISVDIMEC